MFLEIMKEQILTDNLYNLSSKKTDLRRTFCLHFLVLNVLFTVKLLHELDFQNSVSSLRTSLF